MGELLSDPRNLAVFIQLLSAIFSLIYYDKYKKVPVLKLFPFLLWYILFNEVLGFCIRQYISDHNAIIYNVYYGINFTYLLILYRRYLTNKKSKHLVLGFLILYLLAYVLEGFFKNYIKEFQTTAYIIASLCLIITIILYFVEILNSNKILAIKKNLLFWISVGLLIYYAGYTPYRIIRNIYTELDKSSAIIAVMITLTVIMNTCYIIGFIWSQKKEQY
ncbi:hypothetical protein GCM10009430_13160 [Aquimarina litoralis]|uniref:Uncharacterized protein n=1 Tax=Aquimarina litoralis TaxID=584605 RepID=A0ABP3TSJ7_9FLAO